eukprot:6946256-Prymnesium_polylepis.1
MLTASAVARGRHLQTKAQQGRRTESIEKLLPAGGTTVEVPARSDYAADAAGDKQWAKDTRAVTDGFALSRRQRSTAVEHINYMLGWQQLLTEKGFGIFVERCELEAANCLTDGRRAIRAVTEKKKGAKKVTPKVSSATACACDAVQRVWVGRQESAIRRPRGSRSTRGGACDMTHEARRPLSADAGASCTVVSYRR